VKSFIAGGLSRVYFGKCKQTEVAIKVLFAIELTPKVVTDFYTEVQVMYQLRHENIIECLGISVLPPTICVILEYCPHGSLYDFIYLNGEDTSASEGDDASENLRKINADTMKKRCSPEPPSQQAVDDIELISSSQQSHKAIAQGLIGSPAVQNPLINADTNGGSASLSKPVDYDAGDYISCHIFCCCIKIYSCTHVCLSTLLLIISESNRSSVYKYTSKTESVRRKLLGTLSEKFFAIGSSRHTMATTASSAVSESKRKGTLRNLTKLEKYNLMLGACRGVAFLHSKGFMHCDIKSPNFLIAKV